MRFFETSKKEKSVLDLFTYDLTTFFYGEYKEVESFDTEAMFMIVYERKLPWNEMNLLDNVQFKVFFDKNNFTGSNPINVRLFSTESEITPKKVARLVNSIVELYGNDDYEGGEWSDTEEEAFTAYKWDRKWSIQEGESFITMNYDGETFEMNILFLNNIIKHTGKYLNIKS
ncbi:MAG: hypothetical protein PF489_02255 [Salinivirgaceae bacterium]|jgi:hypothetical protein|nr:hypothetical protein [Salinivirgaceae bacterium]